MATFVQNIAVLFWFKSKLLNFLYSRNDWNVYKKSVKQVNRGTSNINLVFLNSKIIIFDNEWWVILFDISINNYF